MRHVLSPKELAQAIGVSESSLKRWADEGLLRATRTAGGHRRIPLAEAIRFLRDTQATLVVRNMTLKIPYKIWLKKKTAAKLIPANLLLLLSEERAKTTRALVKMITSERAKMGPKSQ